MHFTGEAWCGKIKKWCENKKKKHDFDSCKIKMRRSRTDLGHGNIKIFLVQ